MNFDLKTTIDWTVSLLTMGSFLYASIHKERFDTSVQFNTCNLIAGVIFTVVGIITGLYGLMFRQLFFGGVALYNLIGIYKNKNLLK